MSTTAAPAAPAQDDTGKRTLLVGSVMLATLMQALDTTIANVALPDMQGSLSATQDQVSWVLTSYIVAAAILTPVTGWLAGRLGRRRRPRRGAAAAGRRAGRRRGPLLVRW